MFSKKNVTTDRRIITREEIERACLLSAKGARDGIFKDIDGKRDKETDKNVVLLSLTDYNFIKDKVEYRG